MKSIVLLFIILSVNTIYSQAYTLNIGETKAKNYLEKIPFEFVKEKIIIPVKIEGKIYRFILDTGAPNVISKEIYDLIKPKFLESLPITDVNEKEENLNVVLLEKLEIGNLIFEQTATLIYDINSNPLLKCFGVDGFIGSNMLRNSIVQIDKKKKTIFLTDNISNLSVNEKDYNKIELSETQSTPYILINLKGKNQDKELVLIDTGDNALFDISKSHYDIFKEENIFKVLGESEGASGVGAFGGASKHNHFKLLLPSLEISGTVLKNVITETTDDHNSKIGSELLDYGILTIDFINKRLYFSANTSDKNAIKPFFGFSRTLKDDKPVVGFVWDKDLRDKIKYGDEIIAINHIELTESNFCDVIYQIAEADEKNSISFRFRAIDGKITDLELEKKFPQIKN